MSKIQFQAKDADRVLLDRIIKRAHHYAAFSETFEAEIDTAMCITACHLNGCRLDLAKLLEADEFNFLHDVGGIVRHIDRETGKLRHHFLPRCAGRTATGK